MHLAMRVVTSIFINMFRKNGWWLAGAQQLCFSQLQLSHIYDIIWSKAEKYVIIQSFGLLVLECLCVCRCGHALIIHRVQNMKRVECVVYIHSENYSSIDISPLVLTQTPTKINRIESDVIINISLVLIETWIFKAGV